MLSVQVAAPQAVSAAALTASWISTGSSAACAIEGGRAYCWGHNGDGDLGDAKSYDSLAPVPVDTSGVLAGKTMTQISVSTDGSEVCALDSAGAAFCWGSNDQGALGDGSAAAQSGVPVAVDTSGVLAGKTLTQIAVGDSGVCALDSAGAAYCWGSNSDGQLGDNSSSPSSSVPVAVATGGALEGKALTQVTAASQHACALDSAGAAFCWGDNSGGEVGVPGATQWRQPVAVNTAGVLAGKTLTQISAGYEETCAVDSAGAAYCWGLEWAGDFGDNGGRTPPGVLVAVDTGGVLAGKVLTRITVGAQFVCVLDSAGAAYCWGANGEGYELGDGNTSDISPVPVAVDASGVLAGKTLTQIAAGCALDSAGAAYCWGNNFYGRMGDGATGFSDVPLVVGRGAPGNVSAVGAASSALVTWTHPGSLNGAALTGYTATATPGGASCHTSGSTSCTIAGLANGTAYTITLVTNTTAGDSGPSTPADVTPGPLTGTGPVTSGANPAKCIDDSHDSAANDTPVVIEDCNGTAEQNWAVDANGTLQINGKCLDLYHAKGLDGTPVELWTCTGHGNQNWPSASGALKNPYSGKCLDDPSGGTADGTQLDIATCDGAAHQQWKLP
jgi:alpha-tubulin suppressor-like RCC1 family protein